MTKRPPPRHASTALPRRELGTWWVLVCACGALTVGSVVGIAQASAPRVAASVTAPEPRPHATGVRGLPSYAPAPVMSIGVVATGTTATRSTPRGASQTTRGVTRSPAQASPTADGALAAIPAPSDEPAPAQDEPTAEGSPVVVVEPDPVADPGAVTPSPTIEPTPSDVPTPTEVIPTEESAP